MIPFAVGFAGIYIYSFVFYTSDQNNQTVTVLDTLYIFSVII